jgi:hypothetical protein
VRSFLHEVELPVVLEVAVITAHQDARSEHRRNRTCRLRVTAKNGQVTNSAAPRQAGSGVARLSRSMSFIEGTSQRFPKELCKAPEIQNLYWEQSQHLEGAREIITAETVGRVQSREHCQSTGFRFLCLIDQ